MTDDHAEQIIQELGRIADAIEQLVEQGYNREVDLDERATLDNSGDERRTETAVSTTGTIR